MPVEFIIKRFMTILAVVNYTYSIVSMSYILFLHFQSRSNGFYPFYSGHFFTGCYFHNENIESVISTEWKIIRIENSMFFSFIPETGLFRKNHFHSCFVVWKILKISQSWVQFQIQRQQFNVLYKHEHVRNENENNQKFIRKKQIIN